MKTETKQKPESGGLIGFISRQRGVIVLVTCFSLTLVMISVLFTITKGLIIEGYQERASAIAHLAASQLKDAQDEDQLNTIKNSNPIISSISIIDASSMGNKLSIFEVDDDQGLRVIAYAPISNSEDAGAFLALEIKVENFGEIAKDKFMPFFVSALVFSLLITILVMVLAGALEIGTELKRDIEKQKQEMMSVVSHQLATPVSSMKWYTEMLLDGDIGKLSSEQKTHVKTIESVAENLTETVGLLMDATKLKAGSYRAERRPIDLDDLFRDVFHVIDPKAQIKGVVFTKKIQSDLPETMLDKRLVRMTLMNLLSNAIKYTPAGSKVHIEVEISDNKLKYVVRDEGCGIPEDEHDLIFSQLYRASNASNIHGNGLGLYVAKGAVEELGGKINFVSKENEGTEFHVEIPLS